MTDICLVCERLVTKMGYMLGAKLLFSDVNQAIQGHQTDLSLGEHSMLARIYKPAKTAMQSGTARTRKWILEFEAEQARTIDPLMGYTSSSDMNSQVKMSFETKEQAIAHAEKHGIAYQVIEPKKGKRSIKAYSDNFKFGRIGQWTH